MFLVGKFLGFVPMIINLNDGRSYMERNRRSKRCCTQAQAQMLVCHFHTKTVHETMFDGRMRQRLGSLPNHLVMQTYQDY